MSNMTCAYGKWANWHTNMHMFRRAAFVWRMCQKRPIHVKRGQLERPKQMCEKVLLLCGNKSKERYAYEKWPIEHTNRHVKKICTKMAKETYLYTDLLRVPNEMSSKDVPLFFFRHVQIKKKLKLWIWCYPKKIIYLCSFGIFKKQFTFVVFIRV